MRSGRRDVADGSLTPEQILDAAEDVLRRFGPQKTTVVDVARALGVSHGSIYRHFPSKTALREAVARRWLHRVAAPLGQIAAGDGPALPRLRRWLDRLMALKRAKVLDDPELFAVYHALSADAGDVIDAHVAELIDQVARILADGMVAGDIRLGEPKAMARAVLTATAAFHHPAHAATWRDPLIDQTFEAVFDLLVTALAPPALA
ncbi:TetR family transcriptional regulator [Tistrella bauzanensis]|uniref:TetR family transcriptional regulator n=1 Tax=Tistrella arctica TaxID=3133430 RepID=A0ABU9YQK1_9PROT